MREGRPVMIQLRHSHFGCYSLQACSRFLFLSLDWVKTILMKVFQERTQIWNRSGCLARLAFSSPLSAFIVNKNLFWHKDFAFLHFCISVITMTTSKQKQVLRRVSNKICSVSNQFDPLLPPPINFPTGISWLSHGGHQADDDMMRGGGYERRSWRAPNQERWKGEWARRGLAAGREKIIAGLLMSCNHGSVLMTWDRTKSSHRNQ